MTTTANDNDPRVTQTYRDLATEKVPPVLDDKVLAMAAAGARTRYGLARAWMRPVAWAATIGLCLAIVVEVARFNGEPPAQADFDTGRTVGEATMPQGALPATSELPAGTHDEGNIKKESRASSDGPRRLRVSAPPPAATESDSVAEEFVTGDLGKLQEAEEQALMRAGEARDEAAPASAAAFAAKRQPAPACNEEQRASPESWYKCAESLREMGLDDAADLEFEALYSAFPDFPMTGSRVSN